jgi:hypothetical protein
MLELDLEPATKAKIRSKHYEVIINEIGSFKRYVKKVRVVDE